jgi:hypothetical protein
VSRNYPFILNCIAGAQILLVDEEKEKEEAHLGLLPEMYQVSLVLQV